MPELDLLSRPAGLSQPGAEPMTGGRAPATLLPLPGPASPMAAVSNGAVARMTEQQPGISGPEFPEGLGLGNAAVARALGGGNRSERGEAPAAGPPSAAPAEAAFATALPPPRVASAPVPPVAITLVPTGPVPAMSPYPGIAVPAEPEADRRVHAAAPAPAAPPAAGLTEAPRERAESPAPPSERAGIKALAAKPVEAKEPARKPPGKTSEEPEDVAKEAEPPPPPAPPARAAAAATGVTAGTGAPEPPKAMGGPSPAAHAPTGPAMAEAIEPGATPAAPAPAPAAPAITATDPGGILAELAETPPSAAALALGQAEQASGNALAEQRHQTEQGLPEIPVPTGLPSTPAAPPEKPPAEARGTPAEPAVEQRVGSAGAEAKPVDMAVPEAPPMPPPRPTVLPGPETRATEEEQARMAAGAQQALEQAGIDTGQVPASLGPRPQVQMTGEADPQQLDATRSVTDAQVAQVEATAAAGIDADHGLGRIYPAPTDERLTAKRPLAGAGSPPATGGGPALPAPADLAAGLDQSLVPGFRQRLGAERDKYAAGHEQFEADSAQAHRDSDTEIARLSAQAASEQRAERQKAGAGVAAYQQEWRKELDETERDYARKAGAAAEEQRAKIAAKQSEAEQEAAAKFEEAERKAAEKTREAEKKAGEEKARKRKESGGFWGWVKSKASALVDALKTALNAIWDGLRWVVKGLFELAKKAAMIVIDAARLAIVGFIKGFGAILKGFVSLALIAFPDTAKKINAKIEGAVDLAVEKVNAAADKLKGAVAAVLDFLAKTIDKLLGLVQSLFNGILTVIRMLVRGELKELIRRLGYVVDAAKKSPSHFEAAVYEELLGGDFDQPLSPIELLQAGEKPIGLEEPTSQTASAGIPMRQPEPAPEDAGELPRKPWSESNVGVDEVVTGAGLSPEASTEIGGRLPAGGELTIGESASPDRTLDAIMAEATSGGQVTGAGQAPGQQAQESKLPPDGLTPRRRAAIRWTLMKQGLAEWFDRHKVAIIVGAVAAILAIAALIFFSGGTILVAVGPIMAALGPVIIGATVATIAGCVEGFVAKAWKGETDAGAKSLAKGLAAGAVELVSAITFKAGGAALKGAKAAAKAGFKLVKTGAVAVGKFIAKGVKFIISKGKVLLQGAKGFITRQFRRLRELGEALLARLRFKKLRIVIQGRRFALQGFINPWYTVIEGELTEVKPGTKRAVELEEEAAARIKETAARIRVSGMTKSKFTSEEIAEHIAAEGKLQEALEERIIREMEVGVHRPPRHHVFPQERRAWFRRRGFTGAHSIDEFTVELDEAVHQAIHGGGNWRLGRRWPGEWNRMIMRELRNAERVAGHRLTRDEILERVRDRMRSYNIPEIFIPYRVR